MAERESRPSTPALPPPPPSDAEDGHDAVLVPPLEPPPSSLGALARQKRKETPREPKVFWLILIALFVAGTLLTFYLQRPR